MAADPDGDPATPEPANDGGTDERGSHESPVQLTPAQQELIRTGLPMVKQCAEEIAHRFHPRVKPHELLAAGTIALRQSALCYQPDLHRSFPVYARHHIRGRMIDAVRSEHFSLRARVERAMERAYEIFESHHTLDGDLFVDDEQTLLDGARQGCSDLLGAVYLAGILEELPRTPEDDLLAREDRRTTRAGLQKAREALSPAEQEVVRLLYEQGMTIDEAAAEVCAHPNTVQRRHTSALRKLRASLVPR